MNRNKVHTIVKDISDMGWELTTEKFYRISMKHILMRYGIRKQLEVEEYVLLIQLLLELCAVNDMKEMGISYMEDNDWKDK